MDRATERATSHPVRRSPHVSDQVSRSEVEIETVGEDGLEMYVEEQVLDWIRCRFGWGWTCELIKNDFGFMEDSESTGLVVTNEVLNPGTKRRLVQPRAG